MKRDIARFAIGLALVLLMANDVPYSADAWLRYLEKQLLKRRASSEDIADMLRRKIDDEMRKESKT